MAAIRRISNKNNNNNNTYLNTVRLQVAGLRNII